MRAFLAIELNDYVVDKLVKTQQKLDNPDFGKIKMVEKQNMHLTVKFFGDIDNTKLNQITRCINDAKDDFKPFTGKVVGIGAFANFHNPRVIWTTLKDKEDMTTRLLKSFDMEFSNLGFKKEKSYKPHITLGRVKNIKDKKMLYEALESVKREYYGKVDVNKLVLKSSTLTPAGPIYKTVEEFKL